MRREQERTAPPESQKAFREAVAKGVIRIQAPPVEAPKSKYENRADLSPTDVELIAWAEHAKATLLTDEKALFAVAKANRVDVYNLPRMLKALLDAKRIAEQTMRKIVADLQYGPDARIFTPPEKGILGLGRDE